MATSLKWTVHASGYVHGKAHTVNNINTHTSFVDCLVRESPICALFKCVSQSLAPCVSSAMCLYSCGDTPTCTLPHQSVLRFASRSGSPERPPDDWRSNLVKLSVEPSVSLASLHTLPCAEQTHLACSH